MATFSERRGVGRTFLRTLIDRGYSRRESFSTMKEIKYTYRRQDMFRDFKEFSRYTGLKETYKYIPKNKRPTIGTITLTEESLQKEYSMVCEVTGKDVRTGIDKTIFWRVSTDDLMTLAEAEEIVLNQIADPTYTTEIKDYTVKTVGTLQSITL